MSDSKSVYDLVVVGSGPGGYVGAIRAAQLGLRVGLVEKDPFYGGTCLHRGCIPTKSLLHDAAVFEQTLRGLRHGIVADNVRLDFSKVQSRKSGIVKRLAKGVEFLLEKNKVEAITGLGRLAARDAVEVQKPDGSKVTLQARYIMLATGSVPLSLPGLEIDGERILNSDHVLELKEVPGSMVVLGAGAVGVEFASAYARFGCGVTLVELLERIVPHEDEEISKELERALRKQMKIHTGTRFESAEKTDGGVRVTARDSKGETLQWEAEKLLVATGRGPVSEGLGFEEAGIEMEGGYVKVDGLMRTSLPNVFAIGDLVLTPAYAHTASSEGILVAEQIAGHDAKPINYDHVPNCTYCDPEVASVGLTEAKARERGIEVKTGKFPLSTLGKVLILGERFGVVKIVADAKYRELLGVHIVGPRATELIAEACIALTTESTVDEFVATMHAHPTVAEGIKEAAESVFGSAIHM
ncbi:MAG: dihydrolipoyl dehydrogenase [Candidatus Krumholzibacteriia bacterium]